MARKILLKRIHDVNQCLGCFDSFGWPDQARAGYFCYVHLTENWISDPYGREALPTRAVLLDELRADLRDRILRTRFDRLCFAETTHIQPVEHARCESCEKAFIDVTGKRISPIPGKEAEYAECTSIRGI